MDKMPEIPFNKPFIVGKEFDYISQAVSNGQLAGNGEFTRRCNCWLEEHFNARKVMLTHSCTAALEMAAILTGVGPGDEFILPSYTFVSTANAFVLRGAAPVFIDIRPDTMNLDETLIEAAITPRTKVIVAVHYAGVGCDMDAIMDIARRHGLLVVEDAAQGVCATYKGRFLGTIGHLGCYSFHETKNFISGEGGALVINDERFLERAEIVLEKGTNRSQFFRGAVDKYTWVDIGSSYVPSEIIAAFLYAQLEESAAITARRMAIWRTYHGLLEPLEKAGRLRRPVTPGECGHNAHMYYILLAGLDERTRLIDWLKTHQVEPVFHYVPLHNSPAGKRFRVGDGPLPRTVEFSERLLRLPCFYNLTEADVHRIVDLIRQFFANQA